MSKLFCIIRVRDGKVENSDQVVKLCNQVKDGKWLLEITQVNKRSTQQNRYYFGLVIPLVQNGIRDLGTELTKEETHEFLKSRFNYSELVNRDTGQVEHLPRSTTLLNKLAFSEYISKIQQFASEFLNIVIPDPGQQMTIDVD